MVQARTREISNKSLKSSFKRLYKLFRRDRTVQIIVITIVAGGILLGLAEYYIPPYVTTQTYTDNMYPVQLAINGLSYPNLKMNIYSESPNHPINIFIGDNQNYTLNYNLYLINDTNRAIGFGPKQLLMSGQISGPYNIVVNNSEYHMTYQLTLASPANVSFYVPVTETQTVYQYPPANYMLLIPGILLTIGAGVAAAMRLMAVTSDRSRYFMALGMETTASSSRFHTRAPNKYYVGLLDLGIGTALAAIGFEIFGKQFLLSWIGVIFVIAGIALILRGALKLASRL